MRNIIKQLLREGLFDEIPDEDFIRAYTNKINSTYDNLLIKGERNKGYQFILGNKIINNPIGDYNKCETNVFNFIKESLLNNESKYFPVGGFAFVNKTLFPVEHWWVYDSEKNVHIDVTPMNGEPVRCYAGIINTEIQDQILNAKIIWDVDFFKGGYVQHNYFK